MMRKQKTFRNTVALLALMAAFAVAGNAMATKTAPTSQVNINQASVEQLMEIPGIGTAKANAIVEYRSKSPFGSTAELTNVKGIGDKLLAKISPYVTAGGRSNQKSGTADKTLR